MGLCTIVITCAAAYWASFQLDPPVNTETMALDATIFTLESGWKRNYFDVTINGTYWYVIFDPPILHYDIYIQTKSKLTLLQIDRCHESSRDNGCNSTFSFIQPDLTSCNCDPMTYDIDYALARSGSLPNHVKNKFLFRYSRSQPATNG
nr:hypothetical protein [Abalone asfa-like virus]